MKKFKVTLERVDLVTIDVEADNEQEARWLAASGKYKVVKRERGPFLPKTIIELPDK